MRKITRKDLNGLLDFPIIKREDLRKIVGGITQQQFDEWIGVWTGGYVDGWGYVGHETVIYGYPSNWGGYGGGFYEYVTNSEWWQSLMYGNEPTYYPDPEAYYASSLSVVFDRSDGMIYVFEGGQVIASYEAHNNVDSHSNGSKIWTNGTFSMQDTYSANFHPGTNLDTHGGTFGEYGIFRANYFQDESGTWRYGMGLHSGRSNDPSHPTYGCIRTTDEAMAFISQQISLGYHFTSITVQD